MDDKTFAPKYLAQASTQYSIERMDHEIAFTVRDQRGDGTWMVSNFASEMGELNDKQVEAVKQFLEQVAVAVHKAQLPKD